ncbi:MAG: diguanylate cyclase [Geobacteraceae bacterium]|nr:MAG: diguanylate cyclase [Geobacteraceae bacterium]
MNKILIVSQQGLARSTLKTALYGEHIVIEAGSAAEAMARAQEYRPHLIVLDMDMGGENSAEICMTFKEHDATSYIPLILLSEQGQKDDIINGLHAGADDYITKPIDPIELLARIDTHLRTKEYFADLEKSDLLMLFELIDIISVTRNPKKILDIIVEKVSCYTEVSRCSIINIDIDGNLAVVASNDLKKNQKITLDLKNYPEIENALITKRPVVLEDLGSNPLMAAVKDKIKHIVNESIVVVPIIKKQNVIGTFFLRTVSTLKGDRAERMNKLCQIVANISGNALENAVLFETLQSNKNMLENLAIRDSLTGLYNHQYFYARFEEEFSRAERYASPLSCMFIDIDDFKKVNDTYGHIAGDLAIRKISLMLNQLLRKSDIAARYGGDEFVLILPSVDQAQARSLAERVMTMVREVSVPQLYGQRITVSIGLATYVNKNYTSYEELLHYADAAMYRAKSAGKDSIFVTG